MRQAEVMKSEPLGCKNEWQALSLLNGVLKGLLRTQL